MIAVIASRCRGSPPATRPTCRASATTLLVGDIGGPEAIGRSFIDRYIVPFEATSLALLVAAVGAVLLAKGRPVGVGPVIGEAVDGVPSSSTSGCRGRCS